MGKLDLYEIGFKDERTQKPNRIINYYIIEEENKVRDEKHPL